MSRSLLFIAFCWLFPFDSFGQHASFPMWNYTTENGLPSSELYYALQDKQGYMWFATDRGVSRYDGYTFRNYGVKEGLEDLVVFQIVEDPHGKLWFYTLSDRIFFLEGDSILPYEHNDLLRAHRSILQGMANFYVDGAGTVFFSLKSGGFCRFDPQKNRLESISDCYGYFLIGDFGTWAGRSFHVGRKTDSRFDRLEDFQSFVAKNGSFEVCIQSLNNKIFMTLSLDRNQPYRFPQTPKFGWVKTGAIAFLIQLFNTFFYVENGELQWSHFDGSEMECIRIDSHGAIWMGEMRGGGLRRYPGIENIPQNRYLSILKGRSVSYIFEDKRGGIWVTTQENGVFYLPPFQMETYNQQSDLLGSYIHDVAVVDAGHVFFTTQNNYLAELDIVKNALSYYPTYSGSPSFLYWDPAREELWVSGFPFTLWKKGKWYILSGDCYTGKRITPLHQPQHAIATNSSRGFCTFSTETKEVLSSNSLEKRAISDRINCIFQDYSGTIWMGTLNGLKKLEENKLADPSEVFPGFELRINALAGLPDSTIAIGTQGQGLILWKNDEVQYFNGANGLASDVVECLHADEQGHLWVGTRNGLNKIVLHDNREVHISTFSTFQGLPSNQINSIASKGSHIWLATAKGLAHLDDANPLFRLMPGRDTTIFAPAIQELRVNQQNWALSGPFSFKFWQNHLVIQYSALDYLQNGHIQYRYRLNPEEGWNYTQERSLNLPALASGVYRFELQAEVYSHTGQKQWSPSAKLGFSVGKPLWARTWFRGLCALAGIGILAWGWRLNTKRLIKKASLERHILELERSALLAQMNPHFVFNALNSIQGFIQKGDRKNASKYLAKFARLVRSILNQSRMAKTTLEEELGVLREYLDLERMRMDYRFDYQIEVGEGLDTFETTLPPMLIQPYLENAVNHGLGPKETQGNIYLLLHSDQTYLNVTIRDNGVGVRKSQELKGISTSAHKSVGMSITQQRLAFLNQHKGAETVMVDELKDASGNVLGTEVRIKIRIED